MFPSFRLALMTRRARQGALLLASVLGVLAPRVVLAQPTTTRVSVGPGGVQAVFGGWRPGISGDGRFVAFDSSANDLVTGDTNSTRDVFVHDRQTGTTTRVSLGAGGSQGNAPSEWPALSADGRIVAFVSQATNLVAGDTNGYHDVFVHDRATGTTARVSVGPGGVQGNNASFDSAISADGRFVTFVTQATNLVPGDTNETVDVLVHDRATGTTTRASVGPGGIQANQDCWNPTMSADGRWVAFESRAFNLVTGDTNGMDDVFVHDRQMGTTTRVSLGPGGAQGDANSNHAVISGNGRWVAFASGALNLVVDDTNGAEDVFVHDRQSSTTTRVNLGPGGAQGNGFSYQPVISGDGRFVAFNSSAGNLVPDDTNGESDVFVHDRQTGTTTRVSVGTGGTQAAGPSGGFDPPTISADGGQVAFSSFAGNLVPDDTNGQVDVFLYDRGQAADGDGDGLPDDWETRFGLNPSGAMGDDGGAGDPDGDGSTNLQEYQNGTHPRGFFKRYLAEGALNAFFDVRLALLNVGTGPARILLRFLQPGGITLPRFQQLPAGRRHTITRTDLAGLVSPDFSTVIESDQRVVVDRTMSWDGSGYGSHAESSVASPATTWYLAEGSTSGDFALFYLLQNPNPVATTATVRYLMPSGRPPIERTAVLPANSRTTIAVDAQGPELASTDVSAVITAPQPIIVERAMYMTRSGQPFAAGHGAAGVTAPALSWFLAEGATGPFFDLFILLANPGGQPAEVSVDYLLLGGTTHTKRYTVPANGRFTIWVDDEQIPAGSGAKPLDNAAVSSTITSTNGVPVIVERAMWWPSPALTPAFWMEAHVSPGATATATRWAMAEGEVGGSQGAETYILIANTSAGQGEAQVRLHFDDGTSAERLFALPPRSRTNVNVSVEFPAAAGRRFGAIVESLGTSPAQIVVERAMYTSPGGVTWAAGTNALATPLP
jgi:Tol biopolymer transport system component